MDFDLRDFVQNVRADVELVRHNTRVDELSDESSSESKPGDVRSDRHSDQQSDRLSDQSDRHSEHVDTEHVDPVSLRLTRSVAWHVAVLLVVSLDLWVVPFQAAFLHGREGLPPTPLFVLALVGDLFLWVDLALRIYARKHALYTGVTLLELVAVLPIDWVVLIATHGGGAEYYRLFRLLRLLTLRRAVRKLLSWLREQRSSTTLAAIASPTAARALLLFALFVTATHFFACAFFLAAVLDDTRENTWLFRDGITGDQGYMHKYLRSWYWSVITMVTTGLGDIVPLTTVETLVSVIAMLCGTFGATALVGDLTNWAMATSGARAQHENKLSCIRAYHELCDSEEEHAEIDTFAQVQLYLWKDTHGIDEASLLELLPRHLRASLFHVLTRDALQKAPALTLAFGLNLDARVFACVEALAAQMSLVSLPPGSLLTVRGMRATEFFVHVRGRTRVEQDEVSGNRKVPGTLPEGGTASTVSGKCLDFEASVLHAASCDTVRCLSFVQVFRCSAQLLHQVSKAYLTQPQRQQLLAACREVHNTRELWLQHHRQQLSQEHDGVIDIDGDSGVNSHQQLVFALAAVTRDGTATWRDDAHSAFRVQWRRVLLTALVAFNVLVPLVLVHAYRHSNGDGDTDSIEVWVTVLLYVCDGVVWVDLWLRTWHFSFVGDDDELVCAPSSRLRQHSTQWKGLGQPCLWLDVLSVLPIDVVPFALGAGPLTVSLLRVNRLVLLRRLPALWDRVVNLKRWSLSRAVRLFCFTLLAVHVAGCAWQWAAHISQARGNHNWLEPDFVKDAHPAWTWLRSVYFIMVATTTVGYGDIVAHSLLETALAAILVVIGGALHPAFVGAVAALLFRADAPTEESQRRLRRVFQLVLYLETNAKRRHGNDVLLEADSDYMAKLRARIRQAHQHEWQQRRGLRRDGDGDDVTDTTDHTVSGADRGVSDSDTGVGAIARRQMQRYVKMSLLRAFGPVSNDGTGVIGDGSIDLLTESYSDGFHRGDPGINWDIAPRVTLPHECLHRPCRRLSDRVFLLRSGLASIHCREASLRLSSGDFCCLHALDSSESPWRIVSDDTCEWISIPVDCLAPWKEQALQLLERRKRKIAAIERNLAAPKIVKIAAYVSTKQPDSSWRQFVRHPFSVRRRLWSALVLFVVLYELLALPFCVAFLCMHANGSLATSLGVSVWLLFFIVDIISALDAFFRIRVFAQNPLGDSGGKAAKLLEVAAILPIDWLLLFCGVYPMWVLITRSLRLLRSRQFPHLITEVRALLDEHVLSLRPSLPLIVALCTVVFVSAHCCACAFHLTALMERANGIEYTWLQDQVAQGYLYADSGVAHRYLRSLYFTLPTLLVVVIGDVTPVTKWETLMTFLLMSVGVSLNAAVIGAAVDVLSKRSSERQLRDSVDDFLSSGAFPSVLQQKVRDWREYLWLTDHSWHEGGVRLRRATSVASLPSEQLQREVLLLRTHALYGFDTFTFLLSPIVSQLRVTVDADELADLRALVADLLGAMEARRSATNEIVIQEGDPARGVWLLLRGRVAKKRVIFESSAENCLFLDSKSVIGLTECFDDVPKDSAYPLYAFSVRACGPCEWRYLSIRALDQVLGKYAPLSKSSSNKSVSYGSLRAVVRELLARVIARGRPAGTSGHSDGYGYIDSEETSSTDGPIGRTDADGDSDEYKSDRNDDDEGDRTDSDRRRSLTVVERSITRTDTFATSAIELMPSVTGLTDDRGDMATRVLTEYFLFDQSDVDEDDANGTVNVLLSDGVTRDRNGATGVVDGVDTMVGARSHPIASERRSRRLESATWLVAALMAQFSLIVLLPLRLAFWCRDGQEVVFFAAMAFSLIGDCVVLWDLADKRSGDLWQHVWQWPLLYECVGVLVALVVDATIDRDDSRDGDINGISYWPLVLSLARVPRLVRLRHLHSLFRRVEKRLEIWHVRVKASLLSLVLAMTSVVVSVHVAACLWNCVHLYLLKAPRDDWLTRDPVLSQPDVSLWWHYLRAVHFAITTLSSVGYGDVRPVGAAETVYQLLVTVCGATIFASLTALFAQHFAESDRTPALDEEERGDEMLLAKLRHYVRMRQLPEYLGMALQEYARMVVRQRVLQKREVVRLRAALGQTSADFEEDEVSTFISQLPLSIRLRMAMHEHRALCLPGAPFHDPEFAGGVVPTAHVLQNLRTQVVPCGAVLFRRSEPVREVFFLVSGSLRSLGGTFDTLGTLSVMDTTTAWHAEERTIFGVTSEELKTKRRATTLLATSACDVRILSLAIVAHLARRFPALRGSPFGQMVLLPAQVHQVHHGD
ncbi:MAG: hypothetical protein MHM6MM_002300 [Cercozoa sp. M6MM]